MVNVVQLKIEALVIADDMNTAGFFKRIKLRAQIRQILDEIEYQEGRLQFANRPYSKPTAMLPPKQGKRHPVHDLSCACGCWRDKRARFIGF
ncbi:hypothetical protein BSK60_32690 [Paenibacillus odorifer]|nr:hypothetical protein BJP46_30780 [Paenibacillus odorifer]OME06397.1 hypothetical protein BSK60_32690 [Paenibacillus odorifer]